MAKQDQQQWDSRYRAGQGPIRQTPRPWLVSHAQLVDALARRVTQAGEQPRALDVACGTGGTLLWLAQRGWRVTGVDISQEALNMARSLAKRHALEHRVQLLQVDLDVWRPPPAQFHLITDFFFLDRTLLPALAQALRPGGLFVMETFNRHWIRWRPQTDPTHLLEPGELAQLVRSWGWEILDQKSEGPESPRPTDAIVARKPEAA